MKGPLRLALGLAFGLVLPAGAEQVNVVLPGAVTLRSDGLEPRTVSPPVAVSFRHALLDPGHALRISVTAEGEGRILFTTANARGGIGRCGAIGDGLYSTVFESSPSAMAGGFEVVWTLEGPARAGARTLRLRWRLESVPPDAALTSQGRGGERRSGSANPGLERRAPGRARDLRTGADGQPPKPRPEAGRPVPGPQEGAPSRPGHGMP